MKIAVVCNDTRGGVQPYAALAQGLQAAGHEVRAVAPGALASLFQEVDIAVTSLETGGEAERQAAASIAEQGTVATMRMMRRELPERVGSLTRTTLAACEGVDIVTGGVGGMIVGTAVADKLEVPFIETHLQPVGVATGAYPGVLLAGVPGWLGSPGRRLSHHLSELALWTPFKPAVAAARRELGLTGPSRATHGHPVLYGFSRLVVDVPPGSDGRERCVTGYWPLPPSPGWEPPPGLEAFLDAGEPVISLGFGSMLSADPEELSALVLGAIRDAGVRAVLLAGWAGLSTSSGDDVFVVDAVPHEWLFPRVVAVVHHGGAGTTGAALRAGVPAVVVPFGVDQPFWGSRVSALGVGPEPIPRPRLTRERLAAALRQAVGDVAMRERAARLGERIRAEDGVAAAVDRFDKLSQA